MVGPLRVCAGRTRGPGRGGLDLGDRRRGLRPRQKRGSLTGPNPVDRGKKGSKLHVLSDTQGIPLAVAVSGANRHDSLALKPLIRGIPTVRSRRGPRRRRPVKLRADKAYFSAEHLAWLRERGLVARIARHGIESGERLGRHRWKIERSIAWLFGYRRLTVRYERKGSHFLELGVDLCGGSGTVAGPVLPIGDMRCLDLADVEHITVAAPDVSEADSDDACLPAVSPPGVAVVGVPSVVRCRRERAVPAGIPTTAAASVGVSPAPQAVAQALASVHAAARL